MNAIVGNALPPSGKGADGDGKQNDGRQYVKRLGPDDNDSDTCNLFGCKARAEAAAKFGVSKPTLKQQKAFCPCWNAKLDTTNYKPGQKLYIAAGRAHVQANPNLDTLKDVKLTVTRKTGKPDGAKKTVAPIIGAAAMLSDADLTDPNKFNSWWESLKADTAAPIVQGETPKSVEEMVVSVGGSAYS